MDALYVLQNRRSARPYKPDAVPQELLDQILAAGLNAPSARNLQNTIIVLVSDKSVRDQIAAINQSINGAPADPFHGAPVVAVVFAQGATGVEDGSLVMGNMLNAIYALGLGGRWIHRAKESFETEQGKALKAAWGVPEDYYGVGNCIIGYPIESNPQPIPRKDGRTIKVQ